MSIMSFPESITQYGRDKAQDWLHGWERRDYYTFSRVWATPKGKDNDIPRLSPWITEPEAGNMNCLGSSLPFYSSWHTRDWLPPAHEKLCVLAHLGREPSQRMNCKECTETGKTWAHLSLLSSHLALYLDKLVALGGMFPQPLLGGSKFLCSYWQNLKLSPKHSSARENCVRHAMCDKILGWCEILLWNAAMVGIHTEWLRYPANTNGSSVAHL